MPIDGRPPSPPAIIRQAQPQVQIPAVDIAVEVVGHLPLQDRVMELSRLLGRRRQASSRRYPPTVLELITLVARNPKKPNDREWNSINLLSLRFNPETKLVTVDYCVDYCGHDPQAGAFDRRRKIVTYSAPESEVVTRANKKLDGLKKYAEPPFQREC